MVTLESYELLIGILIHVKRVFHCSAEDTAWSRASTRFRVDYTVTAIVEKQKVPVFKYSRSMLPAKFPVGVVANR